MSSKQSDTKTVRKRFYVQNPVYSTSPFISRHRRVGGSFKELKTFSSSSAYKNIQKLFIFFDDDFSMKLKKNKNLLRSIFDYTFSDGSKSNRNQNPNRFSFVSGALDWNWNQSKRNKKKSARASQSTICCCLHQIERANRFCFRKRCFALLRRSGGILGSKCRSS